MSMPVNSAFEPVREDQRETDKYDYRSQHCLVRSADGTRLAAVRAWFWPTRPIPMHRCRSR